MAYNGTLVSLLVKRTGETTYTRVGAVQSDGFSITAQLPDASSKDSEGWEQHIKGIRSATGSITAISDPTKEFSEVEVIEMILNRQSAVIQYGTMLPGDFYMEAEIDISDFNKNSDNETTVSFDFNYKVNGKVTLKTSGS